MDEKWKQELSSQFAGAGSRLAETDPEWVEQCLPYVGYPRSLNAMGIIDEVAQNMENR